MTFIFEIIIRLLIFLRDFPISEDGLVTIICTVIGSLATMLVFYFQIGLDRKREKRNSRSEKEREEKIARTNRESTLLYFLALVKKILKESEIQSKYYHSHAEALKLNFTNVNILQVQLTDDITRVVDKFSHERLFHAYLEKFPNSERRMRIDKFQNIFSLLDYIKYDYEESQLSQRKYVTEHVKRLYSLRDDFEHILEYCTIIANHIKTTDTKYVNNEFWRVLDTSVLNFIKQYPSPTLDQFCMQFIIPLRKQMIFGFRTIPEGVEIGHLCKRAVLKFNEIKSLSGEIGSEFKQYGNSFDEVNGKLKLLIEDLD